MEHSTSRDLTAFVLAGGKSQRMGRDKAGLSIRDGETLLEHALALAESVAGEAKLLAPRARYAAQAWAGQIVEDIYPDHGPLGGIHAGLVSSTTELNLFIGVDMPLLTAALLEFVADEARKSRAIVTAPRVEGRVQPLCAVYRREFAAVAERALREERNKIDALFSDIKIRTIEESELRAAGFGVELFANVNTPKEYERFQRNLENEE